MRTKRFQVERLEVDSKKSFGDLVTAFEQDPAQFEDERIRAAGEMLDEMLARLAAHLAG